MKTTKDIATILFEEIERVSKGEVRKDVIAGITKLTDGLVKLARLEMDFSFRNYGEQQPDVPWIASRPALVCETVKSESPIPLPAPKATTKRGQDIEKQIEVTQAKLRASDCTPALKRILDDKLKLLQNQLERAEIQLEKDE